MRRFILLRRSIAAALLLSLVLLQFNVLTPEVEATYTYVADPTFAEIGWMDVKRVGWDFNPNELLLTVQYQANIPNNPNHYFDGTFCLDTDQNPATGSGGSDYYARFWVQGDGGSFYWALHQWNAASTSWVFVKNLSKPLWAAGGDTVELGIPLADIGSPTAINIYYEDGSSLYDFIQKKYTYNTASEDRSITVDGNPADWVGDASDITDPLDATPSWADVTTIYTTSSSAAKKLYFRIDLAGAPPSPHPETGSKYTHGLWYIYLDTDRSLSTGKNVGGIGADYRLGYEVTTDSASRSTYLSLNQWTGTAWSSVSGATLNGAFAGSCLELSLLLSNIGVTGSAIMDIYIDYLYPKNNDLVPNSGTFTATKASLPSRMLSEASTQILSASANSVHFIYADPYRMVSAPPTPWQAAFAAYDATAAGFVYGLCANTQRICYDSNASIVVAKSPESDPPFNYGKVLLSGKSVVVMGGRGPNWVVDYYERTGQTPLKAYVGATDWGLQTQAGTVVASLPATTDFVHNDLFVVMVFQDTNGNFVLIIYGLGWKGTFAGGIYFKEVIKPNLASYTKRAYVFRWTDAGAMDGVPQASEITKTYELPL